MKQPLKNSVREHYHQQQLNAKQLESLLSLQSDGAKVSGDVSNLQAKRRDRRTWVVAMVAVSACVSIVLFWPLFMRSLNTVELPQLIANEVVMNHLNLKPLESRGSNFVEVSRYFRKLPFRPIKPSILSLRGLAGARYCSLQTVPAAQYRLFGKKGRPKTVYQVAYSAAVFGAIPSLSQGQRPLLRYSHGVRVEIWREKGILFAVAAGED